MSLYIAHNDDFSVRKIEDFLLLQEGVIDANVWTKKQMILACVTVSDHNGLDETNLRNACASALGPDLTPSLVMVQRALRRAA